MGSTKWEQRKKRQMRVRRKLFGTPERPRLAVYRSLKLIYAQVIDDAAGKVIATASTNSPTFRSVQKTRGNLKAAEWVGGAVAEAARAKGVAKIVFDRRGYKYHGRVRVLADAAHKAGLQF